MAWEYNEKTKQLFVDAVQHKPGTHFGVIEDADGMGQYGSIVCGDAMKFYFSVERDDKNPLNDRITKVSYETFGCTSAIAASEALCFIIEQKKLTPIEALKVTNQEIVDFLGGLPQQKIHCSVMGAEALESAVADWAKKRDVELSKYVKLTQEQAHEEGQVVCECFNLTEPFIKEKIKQLNLRSLEDIQNAIKAGGSCGSCRERPGGLRDMLKEIWGEVVESKPEEKTLPAELSTEQKELVEKVVAEKIRPLLKKDGGDIEIIAVKGIKVYCELQGACGGCLQAKTTLKHVVEQQLQQLVDKRITVVQV